jgi:hypothetical protein
MRAIETAISVSPDGTAVIQLQVPRDVSAGVHRAVVIVEEQAAVTGESAEARPTLLPLTFEGWPADCTFRREDLYGDDGR